MVSPVIPGLTDHELEPILQAAREAGALAASYIALRLPREVSPLFQDWLAEHVPDRAAKVMARVRELHGGKDYDPAFGKRMRGEGLWADLMARRFKVAVRRLGLAVKLPPLRCDLFAAPGAGGRSVEPVLTCRPRNRFPDRKSCRNFSSSGARGPSAPHDLSRAVRAARVSGRPRCRRCRPRPTRTRPAWR